jgi:hypothetical protein
MSGRPANGRSDLTKANPYEADDRKGEASYAERLSADSYDDSGCYARRRGRWVRPGGDDPFEYRAV